MPLPRPRPRWKSWSPPHWLWRAFKWFANLSLPKALLHRALEIPLQTTRPEFPALHLPDRPDGKNALVVLPYTEQNAYFKIVELIDKDLKEKGYRIHAVVHNPTGAHPAPWWDYFYYIPDLQARVGELKFSEAGVFQPDSHKVDDWCTPELFQFVAALNHFWKFDVCIVHYIFFSKVFEIFPDSTMKLLYTHDVYSHRNSRLLGHGLDDSVWFSTSPAEEKKGLDRSDFVIAIQEKEAEYFRTLVSEEKVLTLPLLHAPRFIDRDWSVRGENRKLRVGFFASSYWNNIKSLTDFHQALLKHAHLARNVELLVGGEICERFKEKRLKNTRFLGMFADPRDFYAECNVIINPDFFESGLKMKCLEAMSYGAPLLATSVSTKGLRVEHSHHSLSDMDSILRCLESFIADGSLLNSNAHASRETYQMLLQHYDFSETFTRILARKMEKGSLKPPDQDQKV